MSTETAGLLASLVAAVPEGTSVTDVRVGALWTVVASDGGAGMASTLLWHQEGTPAVEGAGHLAGRPVVDLARRALGGSELETSLGLAALNAALPRPESPAGRTNAADILLRLGRGKRTAVVGHFPFVERLRSAGREVDVFELPGRLRPGDLPRHLLAGRLPRADVVAVTATTLLTRSVGEVLGACRDDAVKLLVGPTTPLSPLLWEWGFDVLCGAAVVDPSSALRCAAEGANLRQMEGVEKVTYLRPGFTVSD